MYHYKTCGLPDIWLSNGYQKIDTPYGVAESIDDLDGLHKTIALDVIDSAELLTADEVRFLRKELGMTQRRLGNIVGYSSQSVALWEKGKSKIKPSADRIIRKVYLEYANQNETIVNLVDRLNSIDKEDHRRRRTYIEDSERGWKPQEAA